jgi:hypothetical protein
LLNANSQKKLWAEIDFSSTAMSNDEKDLIKSEKPIAIKIYAVGLITDQQHRRSSQEVFILISVL